MRKTHPENGMPRDELMQAYREQWHRDKDERRKKLMHEKRQKRKARAQEYKKHGENTAAAVAAVKSKGLEPLRLPPLDCATGQHFKEAGDTKVVLCYTLFGTPQSNCEECKKELGVVKKALEATREDHFAATRIQAVVRGDIARRQYYEMWDKLHRELLTELEREKSGSKARARDKLRKMRRKPRQKTKGQQLVKKEKLAALFTSLWSCCGMFKFLSSVSLQKHKDRSVRQGQVHKVGNHDSVEHAYRQAIEENPSHAPSHYNLGWLHHHALKKHDSAEQAYRKAIECDPNYAPAQNDLGLLLQHIRKDNDAAEQAYRKAIECDPEYAQAQTNLRKLLVRTEGMEKEEKEEIATEKGKAAGAGA